MVDVDLQSIVRLFTLPAGHFRQFAYGLDSLPIGHVAYYTQWSLHLCNRLIDRVCQSEGASYQRIRDVNTMITKWIDCGQFGVFFVQFLQHFFCLNSGPLEWWTKIYPQDQDLS